MNMEDNKTKNTTQDNKEEYITRNDDKMYVRKRVECSYEFIKKDCTSEIIKFHCNKIFKKYGDGFTGGFWEGTEYFHPNGKPWQYIEDRYKEPEYLFDDKGRDCKLEKNKDQIAWKYSRAEFNNLKKNIYIEVLVPRESTNKINFHATPDYRNIISFGVVRKIIDEDGKEYSEITLSEPHYQLTETLKVCDILRDKCGYNIMKYKDLCDIFITEWRIPFHNSCPIG